VRFTPTMLLLHPALLPVAIFVVAWWDSQEEANKWMMSWASDAIAMTTALRAVGVETGDSK